MTTIIHDTVIVTGDDNDTVHYGASIAIDGKKIAAIGPDADLQARYPSADALIAALTPFFAPVFCA